MATAKPPLPSVRRVITGHTAEGKATVILDEVQKPRYFPPASINAVHDIAWTDKVPAKNDSEVVGGEFVDEAALHKNEILSRTGAIFRSFDHAPGLVVPFHRTGSVDYGIVTKGQLVLVLDDNQRVILNEGDVVVQRGTVHSWRNETDEWARIFFVGLGAEPIILNSGELKEDLSAFKSV